MSSSQKSFSRRFRLNAISYGYANVVTLLLQLVLVPFFLKSWGTALYADWIVLTGIPMILTLLDLGVAQASNNKATMAAGANDWNCAAKSMHTSLVFALMLGGIIITGMLCAAQFIDWQQLLKLKIITNHDANLILIIMASYLALQLLGGPIEGSFRVIDKTAIGAFLNANRRMMDFIVSLFILFLNGDALSLATSMLLGQIVILFMLVSVVKRLSPHSILGVTHASWKEFLSVLKPAIAYASFPVTQTVTIQGGIQVLNQLVDASTLVGFTMARTLMRLIIQLGVVANSSLKPEISRLTGQGHWESAKHATFKMTKSIIGLACAIYIIAIFIGPQIITWWGHGQVSVSRITLALVGIHTVLNVSWFVPAALLIATNKHSRIATIYGISSVITLFLWIGLSQNIPPFLGASMLLAGPEITVLIMYYRLSKQ